MFWHVVRAVYIFQGLMSLYFLINMASIAVPFLYSFEKRMRFIQHWKAVFLSIIIVAIPFVIWDIIFTDLGIWGFNPAYLYGLDILGLPFEEILFFICIPYACIFTHYAFIHFFGHLVLPPFAVRGITIVLLLFAIFILLVSFPNAYTTCTFVLFIALLVYSLISRDEILSRFYLTFPIILIPFFIVNGILTGSFIQDEIVWYNDAENLGIRMGTIPVEDMFYAFDLLYLNLIFVEFLKPRFASNQNLQTSP